MLGCSNINLTKNNQSTICKTEPSWVLNPPVEDNSIYGVGIAPVNFNGEQAQRKSAIAKAVNEIASQLNTTVNSQTITQAVHNNNQASTATSSVSFQTVNGQKVSAKIIKWCKNPSTGKLYILMKAIK